MKLLNLGCGQRYHSDWINLDFVSNDKGVITHNLLKGIPYIDNSIDVVYHSHVLEHFSKTAGNLFIRECFRVLKNNGIIRIAVPDLEMIAKEYLKNLSRALDGDSDGVNNYEWIMLEMYDQTVRNRTGGEMADYLFQNKMVNEEYVYSRIGEEGRNIRRRYFEQQHQKALNQNGSYQKSASTGATAKSFRSVIKKKLARFLFKNELHLQENFKEEVEIGRFRKCGEIHQWMYDKYSLSKLLREVGFEKVEVKNAFSSNILNWNAFHLESDNNGSVYKPDSLFVEAIKP